MAVAFLMQSDVEGSASGESVCYRGLTFLKFKGTWQASSGSNDYQFLILPGSHDLTDYQTLVLCWVR